MIIDIEGASVSELLGTYARILAGLRRRNVVRTNNAPVGDYAELLVAHALDGDLASNLSEKSYDLIAPEYGKIQVKARALALPVAPSKTQTSPFRSWEFDYAALVMFELTDYSVHRAVLTPMALIRENASYSSTVKAHVAYMRGTNLDGDGVIDITALVIAAVGQL